MLLQGRATGLYANIRGPHLERPTRHYKTRYDATNGLAGSRCLKPGEIMSNLEEHPALNFLPWVGPDYADDGLDGLRVLLLGESHYTKARDPRPTITQEVVRKYGVKGEPQPFFTKAMKAVDPGSNDTTKTRRSFWNSVAFYQFIQASAGEVPADSPTEEMWNEAVDPFRAVIDDLQPHAIVVFGKDVWRHLPEGAKEISRETNGSDSIKLRYYETPSGQYTVAGSVTHASRLNYSVARPRIASLLASARKETVNGG